MSETEVLVTELRADIKKYEAALRRQVKATEKSAQDVERRFQKMSRKVELQSTSATRAISKGFSAAQGAALRLFAALGVAIGFRALENLATSAIEGGDQLAKMSAAAGVSTQTLEELRFAAERSGGSVGGLDASLVRFTKTIGEARADTGALFTLLQKIDPDTLERLQTASSTEDALETIIDRLANASDAFERNAIAAAAFGRTGGTAMAKLAVDAEELRQKFRDLGGGISDDLAKKAEEAQDKLTDLDVVLDSRLNTTVLENIDGFIQFKTLMNDIARAAVGFAANIGNGADALERFLDRLPGSNIREETSVDDLLVKRERIVTKLQKAMERAERSREGLDNFFPGIKKQAARNLKDAGNDAAEFAKQIVRLDREIEQRRRAAAAPAPGGGGDDAPAPIVPTQAEIDAGEKLIEQIDRAWQSAFDDETDRIERVRAQRLDAIREAEISEEERARAISRINAVADKELSELRERQQKDEIALVEAAVDARDRAAGRVIAIANREFDARAALIEEEIESEELRNEALAALAEERAAFEEASRAELPGGADTLRGDAAEIADIRAFEAEKLSVIREAREANLIDEQEFEERRRAIIEESENEIRDIRHDALQFQLRTTASTFGRLADVTRDYAGESSAIFRTLFAAQKAFAVASAVVSTHDAVTKALASAPPPVNFVNAAVVAAAGAAEVAGIVASSFAAGGLVQGPGTGTSDSIPAVIDGRRPAAISNGEFIVNAAATRKNLALLEGLNSGRLGSGGGFVDGGLVPPSIAAPAVNINAPGAPAPIVNMQPPEVNVTNVNAIDPERILSDALATRSGQKLVLNVIGRNRSAVSAELGAPSRVS